VSSLRPLRLFFAPFAAFLCALCGFSLRPLRLFFAPFAAFFAPFAAFFAPFAVKIFSRNLDARPRTQPLCSPCPCGYLQKKAVAEAKAVASKTESGSE
jgi:hypothetical protein